MHTYSVYTTNYAHCTYIEAPLHTCNVHVSWTWLRHSILIKTFRIQMYCTCMYIFSIVSICVCCVYMYSMWFMSQYHTGILWGIEWNHHWPYRLLLQVKCMYTYSMLMLYMYWFCLWIIRRINELLVRNLSEEQEEKKSDFNTTETPETIREVQ